MELGLKLNVRERQFLILFGIIAAITLGYICIVVPLVQRSQEKTTYLETLQAQKAEMDAVLANTQVLQEETLILEEARANYQSFYTKLNSYNIDYILNEMVAEHELIISSLNIGDYAAVSVPVEDGNQHNPDNILLKSNVSISARGSYDAILRFIDALNATTFCLNISQMQIQKSTTDLSSCSFIVEVYGVDVPL